MAGCILIIHLALLSNDAEFYLTALRRLDPEKQDYPLLGESPLPDLVKIVNFLLLIMSGAWLVNFFAQRRHSGDLRFLKVMLFVVVVHWGSYLIFYGWFFLDRPGSEKASNVLAWLTVVAAFGASGLFLAIASRCWPAYVCAGVWFFYAMEEISWGQTLFDWPTPPIFEGNWQHETNLHNYDNRSFDYLYFIVFGVGWLLLTQKAQVVSRYLPPNIAAGMLSFQRLAHSKFLDLLMLWILAVQITPLSFVFISGEYVEQLFAIFGLALAIASFVRYSPVAGKLTSLL